MSKIEATVATKKRKGDLTVDGSFLLSPVLYSQDYVTLNPDPNHPRAIPLPDGPFGDNSDVVIGKNGKEVTFNMQCGPIQDGQNGTTVEAILQFAKTLLEESNKGKWSSRYTSVAITKIDEAIMWSLAKKIDTAAKTGGSAS